MTGPSVGTRARPVTPLGILAARLADARHAAAQADDVPEWLTAELAELATLAGGLDPYLAEMSGAEPEALAGVAARTQAHDWPAAAGRAELGLEQEMLSGHVEGRLLTVLIRAVRATSVLEIGTFTGYATLAMAAALPAGGRVVTCEVDREVAGFAAAEFARLSVGSRIDLRVGPARATLAELATAGERFDLAFLDADKAGYAGYVDDLLDLELLSPHGLLCVDNTLMQGEPWTDASTPNGRAIAEFNTKILADPRLEQVLVPLRDGVTLAVRAQEVRHA